MRLGQQIDYILNERSISCPMPYYEELAARRFRQYKWSRRKAALDKVAASLAINILVHVAPFLERTGLARRRSVEKVSVE